jgi:NAD(P)-dependent dehydrogenase (short-subunit alcohol dehydrogenase family)
MRTAIVTGGSSSIGSEILKRLRIDGYECTCWCRRCEVDVTKPIITEVQPDAVVHVAEVGMLGLINVWETTVKALEKNGGVFVGVSSVHHLKNDDAYARSKRGQEAFLLGMAKHTKIRVNVLRLGHIVGTKAWPVEDPQRLAEIPLGRFGTPEEVAEAVLFMVKAKWMTGSVLTLDGGMSLL